MQTTEKTARLEHTANGSPATWTGDTECFLNVLVVYEDSTTRKWAREVCDRVSRAVGQDAIRTTWWKLGELNQPAVLAGAVSKAMRADVIVVAIHASEGFPVSFYWWACSWLPHRVQETGALVALLALPQQAGPHMNRAREYLRAVARKGHLDFLVEERGRTPRSTDAGQPGESPRSDDRARWPVPTAPDLHRYASRRWSDD